jgi:micrococcal nuclease
MATGDAMGMKPKADGQCATDEPIKGKLSKKGNKIYHEPGSPNYEQVKATECFKTAADAQKAGYHALKLEFRLNSKYVH